MIPAAETSRSSTSLSKEVDRKKQQQPGTGPAQAKRQQGQHFRISLCAAATLGLVLLGQPCTNALPIAGGGVLRLGPIVAGGLPAVLQLPQRPPQPQSQQQQILALHTSSSISSSNLHATEVVESGVGSSRHLLHLGLPWHKDSSGDNSNNNNGELDNSIDHFTLQHMEDPYSSTSTTSQTLVSESSLQSPSPPLQEDGQHLAFLDLFSRVTGKSRGQAELEVWEDRKATAMARAELETRMQLQRLQEQEKVWAVKGDSRIELKQVISKMHAGTLAGSEDQHEDEALHHKAGKMLKDGKSKGKSKQDKVKEKIKATTSKSGGLGGIGGAIKTTPTIFYVPHQDDDALAMALAIREHIEAGRRVIVHLYSDGINALLRDIVSGAAPCTLQHPPHKLDLTLQDVVTGRTHEFRQSLRALGVKDEDIFETGWSDIEPLKDYGAFQDKLKELILGYERKYPGASHKCISGEYDRDSVGRNPTHRACWDVATQLLQEFPQGWPASRQLWDFRFYRTYTYYNPPHHRSAQFIRALPQYLPYKQHALDQYKRWDPSKGELAWGYHSVKALIDAAYNDPHVYLDMLDNDPTNPENLKKVKGKAAMAGRVKMEVDGISEEREQGMFPAVWKSSGEKNTNKMLLEEQGKGQDQEVQDLDDGLMGLHRKIPAGTHIAQEKSEPKWDEKEADMRLQVLKAFDDAAQRPEGKEYRESSNTLATNTGV